MATLQEKPLRNIISSNRAIEDLVQRLTDEFLKVQKEIVSDPQTTDLKIFHASQSEGIRGLQVEPLECRARPKNISLAFCGENSSGKTTALQMFLAIERVLASGDGPITARVTKLTFATGDQACIRIYRTIRDQTLDEPEVSLASFFAGDEPDWTGIGAKVSKHIKRPEGMDEASEDFARWARCLVEIRLPSPILAQGIDVYDTPGFLIGEVPVFTEMLHDLVELIHPTVVFMYGNPVTDDATKSSFVAVQAALRDVNHSNIFFLNSKVDVHRMQELNKHMTEEECSSVLARERAQRYKLLLCAPFLAAASLEGLPPSVDQCRYFDICGALSKHFKPSGPMMNENAMQRIIQFAVDGHLTRAKRGSQLILPMIDSFFDFSATNHPRTPEELSALKTDAMNWASRYFQAFTLYTDRFLTDLFASVTQRFKTHKRPIIDLFRDAKRSSQITEAQILGAIHLAIIRPAVHYTTENYRLTLLESIRSNEKLVPRIVHKRLFTDALHIQDMNQFTATLLEGNGAENSIDTGLLYMVDTISNTIARCSSILTNRLWTGEFSAEEMNALANQDNTLDSQAKRDVILGGFISSCQATLDKQEIQLTEIVQLLGQEQERMLRRLIEEQYDVASPRLLHHHETLQRLQRYSGRFTKIACELRAAQDMATFLAQTPKVHGDARQSSMRTTFTADWGHEKNLWVKKITQPPSDTTHAEAHHHRRVALLQHPHIFNLRYLYRHPLDHQTSELWMIFPPIFSTIDQFLRENRASLSVEQLLHWMTDIADALKTLHAHGLVHRNVTRANILLIEDGKVLLADLADGYDPASTTDGIRKNIKGLGDIGRILIFFLAPERSKSPILDEFNSLMFKCICTDNEESVTAEFAVQKLRSLLKSL